MGFFTSVQNDASRNYSAFIDPKFTADVILSANEGSLLSLLTNTKMGFFTSVQNDTSRNYSAFIDPNLLLMSS